MIRARTEEEFHKFYDRWGAAVFTFSKLSQGDEAIAEAVSAQAFLAYFRSGAPLDDEQLPASLLQHALQALPQGTVVSHSGTDATELPEMILALPGAERAVFLLHSVLAMDFPWISSVNGLTTEEERHLWMNSLLHLRMLLRGGSGFPFGLSSAGTTGLQAGTGYC